MHKSKPYKCPVLGGRPWRLKLRTERCQAARMAKPPVTQMGGWRNRDVQDSETNACCGHCHDRGCCTCFITISAAFTVWAALAELPQPGERRIHPERPALHHGDCDEPRSERVSRPSRSAAGPLRKPVLRRLPATHRTVLSPSRAQINR